MTEKFKNKYRISSARLKTWDYGCNGAYYITICTLNRKHFLGDIINGKMRLNEIGKIVEREWIKTPELRSDMNLELDEFVVMPNHFHGIIIIGENQYNTKSHFNDRRDAMHCVSTHSNINNPIIIDPYFTTGNQFAPQSKNLASVIRGIKSSVTTQVKKTGNNDFAWQTRYHEHIIRNSVEFYNIRNYIINNPANWDDDDFYD